MNNNRAIIAKTLYTIDILVAFSPIHPKPKSKKSKGNDATKIGRDFYITTLL